LVGLAEDDVLDAVLLLVEVVPTSWVTLVEVPLVPLVPLPVAEAEAEAESEASVIVEV
jgi:hypothetical protein